MVGDLDDWKWLVSPEARPLLAELESVTAVSPALISRLRKRFQASQVAVAAEFLLARQKARLKFPFFPELVADVEGVEQATSAIVARHKARRFRDLGSIADLCCGIGGDSMALAEGCELLAVDLNPIRAWMAGINARCASVCRDVAQFDHDVDAIHIDPARRSAGRRLMRWHDYQPGPEVIRDLLDRYPDAAVKLGPGIDLASLPVATGDELEFISDDGQLVQCVWWRGRLAQNPSCRTASLLPHDVSLSGPPEDPPPGNGPLEFVHIVDAAAERGKLLARLADQHGLKEVHPGVGWLTSAHDVRSKWWRSFRVVEKLPWRQSRVRHALRLLGAGRVTIRPRGVDVDTDALQIALRGQGVDDYEVLIYRRGKVVECALAIALRSGDND